MNCFSFFALSFSFFLSFTHSYFNHLAGRFLMPITDKWQIVMLNKGKIRFVWWLIFVLSLKSHHIISFLYIKIILELRINDRKQPRVHLSTLSIKFVTLITNLSRTKKSLTIEKIFWRTCRLENASNKIDEINFSQWSNTMRMTLIE